MSAAESITAALVKYGRPMTLRRHSWAGTVDTPTDVTVYGVKDANADPILVNGITQTAVLIKFSNAEIAAASWPGPPVKGDTIITDGVSRTIEFVDTKYLGTTVLAFFCHALG